MMSKLKLGAETINIKYWRGFKTITKKDAKGNILSKRFEKYFDYPSAENVVNYVN